LIISAERWLGKDYNSLPNERYVPKDDTRQISYVKHETTSKKASCPFRGI